MYRRALTLLPTLIRLSHAALCDSGQGRPEGLHHGVHRASDGHAAGGAFDPYFVLAAMGRCLGHLATDTHLLVAVERGEVSVFDRLEALCCVCVLVNVAGDGLEHDCEGKRAVDQHVAMALDAAGIVWVEVYEVGVPGQGGEAEEHGAGGRKDVGEVGLCGS